MPAHCKWEGGRCDADGEDAFLRALRESAEPGEQQLFEALRHACTRQNEMTTDANLRRGLCEADDADNVMCQFRSNVGSGQPQCILDIRQWNANAAADFGGRGNRLQKQRILMDRCTPQRLGVACTREHPCDALHPTRRAQFMDEAGECREMRDLFRLPEWAGSCEATAACPHDSQANHLYHEEEGRAPANASVLAEIACGGFRDRDEARRACNATAECAAFTEVDGEPACLLGRVNETANLRNSLAARPGTSTFVRHMPSVIYDRCVYTCAKRRLWHGTQRPPEESGAAGPRALPPPRGAEGRPGSCWVYAEGCDPGFSASFPTDEWVRDRDGEADAAACLGDGATGGGRRAAAEGACDRVDAHWITPTIDAIDLDLFDDDAPAPYDLEAAVQGAEACTAAREGAANARAAAGGSCASLASDACDLHYEQCPMGMRKNARRLGLQWALATRAGRAAAPPGNPVVHWPIGPQYAVLDDASLRARLAGGETVFTADDWATFDASLDDVTVDSVVDANGRWYAPVPEDACFFDDDADDAAPTVYECVATSAAAEGGGGGCAAREVAGCDAAPALTAAQLEREMRPLSKQVIATGCEGLACKVENGATAHVRCCGVRDAPGQTQEVCGPPVSLDEARALCDELGGGLCSPLQMLVQPQQRDLGGACTSECGFDQPNVELWTDEVCPE